MAKLSVKLSAVAIVLLAFFLNSANSSAEAEAEAEAEASAQNCLPCFADCVRCKVRTVFERDARTHNQILDVVFALLKGLFPGNGHLYGHNELIILEDLLASVVATISILGIPLVEILGLGK